MTEEIVDKQVDKELYEQYKNSVFVFLVIEQELNNELEEFIKLVLPKEYRKFGDSSLGQKIALLRKNNLLVEFPELEDFNDIRIKILHKHVGDMWNLFVKKTIEDKLLISEMKNRIDYVRKGWKFGQEIHGLVVAVKTDYQ